MNKPLTANAAQCRKALLTLTPTEIRASAKNLGWALLALLQEGIKFSARKTFEAALDWDATLLMQQYVVFTASGIDRTATDAARAVRA